jgi:hypothetical protein
MSSQTLTEQQDCNFDFFHLQIKDRSPKNLFSPPTAIYLSHPLFSLLPSLSYYKASWGSSGRIGHATVRFGRSELTGTRIKQKGMFDFVTEDCEDFVNRTKGLTIRE